MTRTAALRSTLICAATALLATACETKSSTTTTVSKPVCDTLHPYGLPRTVKTVVRNCELGYEGFYWNEGLIPLLATQVLTPTTITGDAQKAYELFPDQSIPASSAVTQELYTTTGYVPTQLVPMGDYGGNSRAMGSTLFITNTVPMTPLFAREVWGKLNTDIRDCAKTLPTAYIFTGALPGAQRIADKVNIPLALFKVIISDKSYRAFLVPNDNSVATSGKSLRSYETSLGQLKKRGVVLAPEWKGSNRDRPGTLCEKIL